MTRTIAAMLAVLILSLGVCIFSVERIHRVTGELDGMRVEVLGLTERGDREGAKERMAQLAEVWSRHEATLETIAPHDALHEVTVMIVESDANLSSGDMDDFARSMALLGEAIEHLYTEEQLKLKNIL